MALSRSFGGKMNRLIISILICLLLAGCNLPEASIPLGINLPPQSWIDAPLDGSRLPLAAYPVVFHGSDPGGVAQGEFSVNGQVLANPGNPDAGNHLVVFRVDWIPPAPGEYTLQTRARNSSGDWSDYAAVTVFIGEPTITPTLTPTFTLTPTPTLTHTTTATLAAGSVFSNLRLSTNVFYRLDEVPTRATFTVKVDDPAGIKLVEIYFRLRDPNTNETTSWANESMTSSGGGMYTYTLRNAHPALTPSSPKTMILEYQFIVTHPDLSLTRSPLYGDVTLQG
jgi:hypothetical protein